MFSAGYLAAKAGVEKEWLKINVRKLKNLGLTISHQSGYELSPRGQEFLRRTTKRHNKRIESNG
jgi:Mn-dependent DtxR family transcriptional regulator